MKGMVKASTIGGGISIGVLALVVGVYDKIDTRVRATETRQAKNDAHIERLIDYTIRIEDKVDKILERRCVNE